jgi:preprotein translocase subunit SecA
MTWDMVPYDVQLIGAIVLHQGKIAEMATGEGKTLVATMPLYLNALARRGAHLVTVNDYLARRDSQWMGTVYEFLGLSVGCLDDTSPGTAERRAAYECDITYGTNNEFGFDYLRDNMVVRLDDRVQGDHFFAIIDEVDSVLIDEARTPLIISGPAGRASDQDVYKRHNAQVAGLVRQQGRIVNQLVAEAGRLLDDLDEEEPDADAEWEAGEKLLAAQRGAPKNRRLMKLFNETGVKQLVQRTEAELMREKRLQEVDELLLFSMDEKGHTIQISDRGLDVLSPKDAEAFVVPDISEIVKEVEDDEKLSADDKRNRVQELEREYAEKSERIHVIHQLVKAHSLYEKDVEYVLENGNVVIVDQFTGRKMEGRRWSDGLHQAVEAKEGAVVREETQTLATITIQNYFRMYEKLSGMTGTAETEEGEFHEIYGLEVVVIPTNRPVRRMDQDDVVFRAKREKYAELLNEIERLHERGLPILVGTTSVDVSEKVARMLKRRGLKHEVLNAKQHEREANIVLGAGQPGAITIATNMAGRGTDIKLGDGVVKCGVCGLLSNEPAFGQVTEEPDMSQSEIKEMDCYADPPCGLQILGTERHESRRIDRQLRGRSGRQGDPGGSRFFLSLEDDLMRLFLSDRVTRLLDKLGAEEGEVLTHPMITKSIERAQKRVEMQNFEARKRLLEYDDVMNQQREVIYDLRLFALEGGEDLKGEAWEMIETALRNRVELHVPPGSHPENWDLGALHERLLIDYFLVADFLPKDGATADLPWEEPEEVLEQGARAGSGVRPRSSSSEARVVRRPLGEGPQLHRAFGDRREVEGPPLRPRPPPRLHPLPGVRSARSADRVQEGSVRDVRRPSRRHASERREPALPGARGALDAPSTAGDHRHERALGHHRHGRARGAGPPRGRPGARGQAARVRGHGGGDRRRGGPGGDGTAGGHATCPAAGGRGRARAERPLSVRFGQEVQEVPRKGGVAGRLRAPREAPLRESAGVCTSRT